MTKFTCSGPVSLKPDRKTAHKTAQINSYGQVSPMTVDHVTAQPHRRPPHHTHINIKTTEPIKIIINNIILKKASNMTGFCFCGILASPSEEEVPARHRLVVTDW